MPPPDYAQQIPVRVIAHILGVSPDLSDTFTGWVRDVLEFADDHDRRVHGVQGLLAVLHRRGRQAHSVDPGDDLLSELLQTEVDGAPIEDSLVLGAAALVLIAGVDTTWSAIGSSLWHLATHPDDRKPHGRGPRRHAAGRRGAVARLLARDHGARRDRGRRVRRVPHEGGGQDPHELPRRQPRPRGVRGRRRRHPRPGPQPPRGLRLRASTAAPAPTWRAWSCGWPSRSGWRRIPEFRLADGDEVTWAGGQVRGPRRLPCPEVVPR